MAVLQSSVNWTMINFYERLNAGAPYVYGGVYSPTDFSQGCDCSGLVGWVLEALVNTPANMSWEHVVSTESWPYDYGSTTPAAPGTVGPYGTIAVASVADVPQDAALLINIMHQGGGENSHMNCQLWPGATYMESNGGNDGFPAGTVSNGTGAYSSDASLWTDHWYLEGPIIADTIPHWLCWAALITDLTPLGIQLAV